MSKSTILVILTKIGLIEVCFLKNVVDDVIPYNMSFIGNTSQGGHILLRGEEILFPPPREKTPLLWVLPPSLHSPGYTYRNTITPSFTDPTHRVELAFVFNKKASN